MIVRAIRESMIQDLKHWRDASASCDHTNFFVLVRLIFEFDNGALDFDKLVGFHGADVLADLALRIALDEICQKRVLYSFTGSNANLDHQIEMPVRPIRRNWRIRPYDIFAIHIGSADSVGRSGTLHMRGLHVRPKQNKASNRKVQRRVGFLQIEPVNVRIVVHWQDLR